MDPTMGFRTAREGLSAINYFLMHRYSSIPPPLQYDGWLVSAQAEKKPTPCPVLVEHDITAIT